MSLRVEFLSGADADLQEQGDEIPHHNLPLRLSSQRMSKAMTHNHAILLVSFVSFS